jgi:hypothetical protein
VKGEQIPEQPRVLREHTEIVGQNKSRVSSMTKILVKRPLEMASRVAVFGAEFTVT